MVIREAFNLLLINVTCITYWVFSGEEIVAKEKHHSICGYRKVLSHGWSGSLKHQESSACQNQVSCLKLSKFRTRRVCWGQKYWLSQLRTKKPSFEREFGHLMDVPESAHLCESATIVYLYWGAWYKLNWSKKWIGPIQFNWASPESSFAMEAFISATSLNQAVPSFCCRYRICYRDQAMDKVALKLSTIWYIAWKRHMRLLWRVEQCELDMISPLYAACRF